ncbi:hypothetical protein ANCDUO_26370 [Ancylostoma duodenale]|uniref:Uncharacterized protein n=1 Tax=Ancylostoma duodenale TaxID=51022 RepID=A0A0C2F9Q4_9BILA|nr:hypothetical protein ANCDUO_26370 [Ancylostoma duodenale]
MKWSVNADSDEDMDDGREKGLLAISSEEDEVLEEVDDVYLKIRQVREEIDKMEQVPKKLPIQNYW